MSKLYDNSLKKKLCEYVCIHGHSTIKTAEKFNVPLKTFEKWITAYNKDNHCFDVIPSNDFQLIKPVNSTDNYDDLSNNELKQMLMKKDIEIARLKKGYQVEGGGMDPKVFVSLSKKNTK